MLKINSSIQNNEPVSTVHKPDTYRLGKYLPMDLKYILQMGRNGVDAVSRMGGGGVKIVCSLCSLWMIDSE